MAMQHHRVHRSQGVHDEYLLAGESGEKQSIARSEIQPLPDRRRDLN
jgi:hypothetical protein